MSATETTTAPAAAPLPTESGGASTASPVELKSLEKVYAVPVIKDFLSYVHAALSSNSYVAPAYTTGLGFSTQAYEYSKTAASNPYVAPLIGRADGAVLNGLNAVEARFPYPFQTTTEKIYEDANGQFDARVKTPVAGFAANADARLAPLLDQLEVLVNKYSTSEATSATPGAGPSEETQVARAIRLGKHARDQIAVLSSEQLKHLQQQNVIVQRATESVYKLNDSLQAISKDYSAKVNTVSTDILSEVEKVKASVASLPSFVQTAVKPLQAQLTQSATDLQTAISEKDVTTRDKATKVASAVQNQIGPVLEALKETFNNFSKPAAESAEAVSEKVEETTS